MSRIVLALMTATFLPFEAAQAAGALKRMACEDRFVGGFHTQIRTLEVVRNEDRKTSTTVDLKSTV